MRRQIVAMVVVSSFLAVGSCAWGSPSFTMYTVTDLGTLGGTRSEAYDINASGQVVGYAYTDRSYLNEHGFLYSNGTMHDLGTLGGSMSQASGVNASGQVAGTSNYGKAFLYDDGQMTDLGNLPGCAHSYALGINDDGQVVGYSDSGGTYHAFLYSDGVMTSLGKLPDFRGSWANAINDSGQIAGFLQRGVLDSMCHAFLYTDGVMTDLGTLGGELSKAFGINDLGQVVGVTDTSSGTHAFLYTDSTMTDLGTLGTESEAYDINNVGQIVGRYTIVEGSTYFHRPFLYSGGVMVDLNDLIVPSSDWTFLYVHAINDRGLIVGQGYNSLGQLHALLLTPVPEPSSLLLCIICLGLLACLRRRR